MTAGNWAAVVVGIAAVIIGLATIPASRYRWAIFSAAVGMVVLALAIGFVSLAQPTEQVPPTASPSTSAAPAQVPTSTQTPTPTRTSTQTPTRTPRETPSRTPAPVATGSTPVGQVFYDVNSDNGDGAVVAEIHPGGGVEQPFTPTAYQVSFVGVVTSRDPSRGPAVADPACPDTAVGKVRYEVVHRDGRVLRDSGDLPACRDTATPRTLNPPLPVEAGERYILRVTNRTDTILSIYFNRAPGVEPFLRIRDEVDATAARGKSVSGRISG